MLDLNNGLQIVLQTEINPGNYRCEGFSGIPAINPSFIAIISTGSPSAKNEATKLRQQLISTILSLNGNVRYGKVPCSGNVNSLSMCHAHGVKNCRKLLVIVGDKSTSLSVNSAITQSINQWKHLAQSAPNDYHILTVFPQGTAVQYLLPPLIQNINSAFWSQSIAEVIPNLLGIAGITPKDFRIFISYKTSDTQALAEQLFDFCIGQR